jgi:hypothetical protein
MAVTEGQMSDVEKSRGSGIGLVDAVLVTAAVVGGILVLLWVLHAVVGIILFVFKVAIVIVVVAVIIRLVHHVTRRSG